MLLTPATAVLFRSQHLHFLFVVCQQLSRFFSNSMLHAAAATKAHFRQH